MYGTKAMTPIEFFVPIARTQALDRMDQERVLRQQLLLAEEKKDVALVNLEAYHQRIRKYFSSKVKYRQFLEGEWVLYITTCNTREWNASKLGAK